VNFSNNEYAHPLFVLNIKQAITLSLKPESMGREPLDILEELLITDLQHSNHFKDGLENRKEHSNKTDREIAGLCNELWIMHHPLY
jgi:hypothetical protein